MPLFVQALPRKTKVRRFLTVLLALTASAVYAKQTPPTDQDSQELRADCRLEGEAGGLVGSDLEQFIDECVADLLSVEFANTGE